MFTGIVEEAGSVLEIRPGANSIELIVRAELCAVGAKVGDSIAVNGCCLTVIEIGPNTLEFDLLNETWNRTNFRFLKKGALLNLERSLPADGRLHGHFVTGHIDGTGQIDCFEKRGSDWYLRIVPPSEILRYIVQKGSIAVDGMSLTVAEVTENAFAIWIIPHTYAITALHQRAAGDLVNLEADLLAKYLERLVRP